MPCCKSLPCTHHNGIQQRASDQDLGRSCRRTLHGRVMPEPLRFKCARIQGCLRRSGQAGMTGQEATARRAQRFTTLDFFKGDKCRESIKDGFKILSWFETATLLESASAKVKNMIADIKCSALVAPFVVRVGGAAAPSSAPACAKCAMRQSVSAYYSCTRKAILMATTW